MAEILVVEDDPAVSETLSMLLESDGHSVRIAANGAEGIELLRDRRPQLALSDIEMPILDGPGMVYRMFLEDQGMEDIPVLLISGFPNIRTIADQIGTPYFLAKPFDIEQLLKMVRRALDEKTAPKRPDPNAQRP